MKVSLSDSALQDLEKIKEYYLNLEIPEIGENFVIAIFEHIESLIEHPDIGRIVPEFSEEHIRELIHPPFRVVYLRGKASIQIIRIWRSERLLSLSENEAAQAQMTEDQEELLAISDRVHEPEISYEALLNDLKKHSKL